jgi:polyhydroxyalkanoate synthase subunit PhaC
MTDQSSITEPAADAAGALDLMLADAALGPLRRMLPGMSGVKFVAGLARRPRGLAVRGTDLLREYAHIATGGSAVSPAKGDRRFSDPAWTGNPVLRRLVQVYLATARTTESLVMMRNCSGVTRSGCASSSPMSSTRSPRATIP